jgi:hypothetical protein
LDRRGGFLNFDGFEVDAIDTAISRHQKPLRLPGADRQRLALKVLDSLDRRLFTPHDCCADIAKLADGLNTGTARSRNNRRRNIGKSKIRPPGRNRPHGIRRTRARLNVRRNPAFGVKTLL